MSPGVPRPTVGVEEEFLLVDPGSARPVPAAPRVLRLLAGAPGLQPELMRYQVEANTSVCTSLAELQDELTGQRRRLAGAAAALGCRLVATGAAPVRPAEPIMLSDSPRYHELARRYPALTSVSGTCGCHVHVGVPDRDTGIGVLARLRPWLPLLLVVSANSPIENGCDSGWASRRYRDVSRWPTGRPPAVWRDAGRYDACVRRLIQRGAALDERSVYFLARLSPRYPTVEVRVADVCLDSGTAVLVAALARALVATALAAGRHEPPPASRGRVEAALAAAARHGLTGDGVDPLTGAGVPHRLLLDRLLNHVEPALDALGDRALTETLVRRLDTDGTGAQRQRAVWAARGPAAYADLMAAATVAAPEDRRVDGEPPDPPAGRAPSVGPPTGPGQGRRTRSRRAAVRAGA